LPRTIKKKEDQSQPSYWHIRICSEEDSEEIEGKDRDDCALYSTRNQ
jgi:hypothetical protein